MQLRSRQVGTHLGFLEVDTGKEGFGTLFLSLTAVLLSTKAIVRAGGRHLLLILPQPATTSPGKGLSAECCEVTAGEWAEVYLGS